jgi:hypothetical protein
LRQAAGSDALGGFQRDLEGQIFAAEDLERPNRLTFSYRCRHWSSIDDLGDDSLGRAARDQQANDPRCYERHVSARPTEQPRFTNDLPFRKQQARFESAESKIEQLARFLVALLGGLQAVHDEDQPLPVLHGGTDQSETTLHAVSGVEPIGADAEV